MANKDRLLGWDVSPYTAKVRSYFNYKKIPYDYKPPNAYTLARKVQPAVGKMIMPTVFKANGDVLQDSSVIIDHYETLSPDPAVIPETLNHKASTLLVELFADEWLPLAALHYRWNYPANYHFIISEFGKNALPHFPKIIQRQVARQFAGKMSGYLPILGITKAMQPALEAEVENLLSALDAHFSQYAFLLGSKPTLGDFALYGPLYAHLERDPEPADLIKKHHHLHAWLMKMHDGLWDVRGDLVDDDKIPDTLVAILKLMDELYAPIMRTTVESVNQWAKDKPDADKLPQRLGNSSITLQGETESRYNLTYGYWMLQRLYDFLGTENIPNQLKGVLAKLELLQLNPELRVQLKQSRLYRA